MPRWGNELVCGREQMSNNIFVCERERRTQIREKGHQPDVYVSLSPHYCYHYYHYYNWQ